MITRQVGTEQLRSACSILPIFLILIVPHNHDSVKYMMHENNSVNLIFIPIKKINKSKLKHQNEPKTMYYNSCMCYTFSRCVLTMILTLITKCVLQDAQRAWTAHMHGHRHATGFCVVSQYYVCSTLLYLNQDAYQPRTGVRKSTYLVQSFRIQNSWVTWEFYKKHSRISLNCTSVWWIAHLSRSRYVVQVRWFYLRLST